MTLEDKNDHVTNEQPEKLKKTIPGDKGPMERNTGNGVSECRVNKKVLLLTLASVVLVVLVAVVAIGLIIKDIMPG